MGKNDLNTRKREIKYTWVREKDGPWLPRPPPMGNRPPNGLIWAARQDDFYRMQRAPGVNVMTCWSLSMVKEFNENFHLVASEFEPEPDPRLDLPFPWLRLPVVDPTSTSPKKKKNTLWRSIQGTNRSGGIIHQVTGFKPQKKVQFGSVYGSKFTLEEFIPASYFPDILLVNDPKGITEGKRIEDTCSEVEATPRKYKRVWPIMDPAVVPNANDRQNVATLNFAGAPLLGKGHHSAVHRASLKLPGDLEAYTGDGSIAVAAKVAFPSHGARNFLKHEGNVYNRIYGRATDISMDCIDNEGKPKMPLYGRGEDGEKNMRHLMEHWNGYNLPSPHIRHPVPVGAVVPKFFGYYVPTDEAEEIVKKRRKESNDDYDDFWQGQRYDSRRDNASPETLLSPILLIEDCGTPIKPNTMTIDDRTECLSFLARLYFEGMSHSSFYARNVVVQPGPLTVPPIERSLKTPSYRIIDLGRAESWKMRTDREKASHKEKTGKDLEDCKLPIGNDGYVRDDIPYEGDQAVWKGISRKWALDKDSEFRRAKEELLFDEIIEPNINGMTIEIVKKLPVDGAGDVEMSDP